MHVTLPCTQAYMYARTKYHMHVPHKGSCLGIYSSFGQLLYWQRQNPLLLVPCLVYPETAGYEDKRQKMADIALTMCKLMSINVHTHSQQTADHRSLFSSMCAWLYVNGILTALYQEFHFCYQHTIQCFTHST